MEGGADVRAGMLYDGDPRRAQDRRLRLLQNGVMCCALCVLALLGLTVYQMTRGTPEEGKTERCPQLSGPLQDSHSTKPRAHVTGTRQPTEGTQDNVLQWESENGLAFVEDGMRYENKAIAIPKKGFYFVYAQVSLKIPNNFRDHFLVEVLRENDNYPETETILSGKVLKGGQQTIYSAGLVRLARGDRLKVKVTAADQVDIRTNGKTFFGAFWVVDSPSK